MGIHFYSKKTDENLKTDEEKYNRVEKINIGNPISVYHDEKERDLFRFLLKPSVLSIFLSRILEKQNNAITIIDFGCGNGSNSRIIVKGILDSYNETKIKIIFVDVCSDLLREADRRSQEFMQNYKFRFSYELIQLDLTNCQDMFSFARDYENKVDFSFSIKFFHNTSVKIDRDIASVISRVTKIGGIFVNQFCCYPHKEDNIKMAIAYLLGQKYGNSAWIDRYFADKFLKNEGFNKIYDVTQRSLCSFLSFNHFYKYAIERYYYKSR